MPTDAHYPFAVTLYAIVHHGQDSRMVATGTSQTLADAATWVSGELARLRLDPQQAWVEATPACPAGAGEWAPTGTASWVGVFTGAVVSTWVPTDVTDPAQRR